MTQSLYSLTSKFAVTSNFAMKGTAPPITVPLFIRTASASSQRPFLLQEKEQAEVGQSPTLCPYATATGSEAFSGNALIIFQPSDGPKTNSLRNSKAN